MKITNSIPVGRYADCVPALDKWRYDVTVVGPVARLQDSNMAILFYRQEESLWHTFTVPSDPIVPSVSLSLFTFSAFDMVGYGSATS